MTAASWTIVAVLAADVVDGGGQVGSAPPLACRAIRKGGHSTDRMPALVLAFGG